MTPNLFTKGNFSKQLLRNVFIILPLSIAIISKSQLLP